MSSPGGAAIPPSCSAVRRDLEAYVLGEMDGDAARGLREHLRGCRDCSAQGVEIAWLLRDVREVLTAGRATPAGGSAGAGAAAAGRAPAAIRRAPPARSPRPLLLLGSGKGFLFLVVVGLAAGAAWRMMRGGPAGDLPPAGAARVAVAGDAAGVEATRGNRGGGGGGGGPASARLEALAMLVASQDDQGSWDLGDAPGAAFLDPGVTALAALALLEGAQGSPPVAEGEDPAGATGERIRDGARRAARRACVRLQGFVGEDGVITSPQPIPLNLRVPLQAACARALAAAAEVWPEDGALRDTAGRGIDALLRWQRADGSFGMPDPILPPDAFATALAWSALDQAARAGLGGGLAGEPVPRGTSGSTRQRETLAEAERHARSALEGFGWRRREAPGAAWSDAAPSSGAWAPGGRPASPFPPAGAIPIARATFATGAPVPPERMLARALLARVETSTGDLGLPAAPGTGSPLPSATIAAGGRGSPFPQPSAAGLPLPAWGEVLRLASVALAPPATRI